MDYRQALKDFRNRPDVKSLVKTITVFKTPGQFVLGKIIDVCDFDLNQYKTPCQKYIMDTVNGRISFILGDRIDKEMEGIELKGRTLLIQFNGKIDLDNGKTCNLFTVDDLTDVNIKDIEKSLSEEINDDERKIKDTSKTETDNIVN